MYILGVDAGATKTSAVILKDSIVTGHILAGPMNINHLSDQEFRERVREVVAKATQTVGISDAELTAAGFGIASIDTEKIQERARSLISSVLVETKNIVVVNDVRTVLPTGSEKSYGIAVVVGTGSNFYGINQQGDEAFVGGLDWRLSDEASAYWVGDRVLRAVVRAGDGRAPQTKLTDLVLKHFDVASYRELANIVYQEEFDKAQVAQLGKLVDEAYEHSDAVATQILDDAASEIILAINTLVQRLHMQDEEFDVVAVGGKFQSPFPFTDTIQKKLIAPKATFKICEKDPAEGAAKLALQLLETNQK